MKIASAPAIAGRPREPAVPEPSNPIPEPVSPELVLVDPTLREVLLARESAARVALQVVPDVEPPETPPESVPEREPVAVPKIVWFSDRQAAVPAAPPPQAVEVPVGRWRKPVRVILPISLALNAILIALSVSDATVSPQASSPAPAIDATVPGNTTQTTASPPKGRAKAGAASGVTHPRNAGIERKVLNLIVQAPAGRLPRALIDPKSGLAKNGLQAVCRREMARSYLCLVQPPRHMPGEGLYARYRLNRNGNGGTFRWYRYRKG
jgi:hypothetical protein